MERIAITVEGYKRMEAELKKLKSEERPAVIQAIAEARAHGDLSENAEYDAAKEKQGFIEARISDLEARVTRADVIDVAAMSGPTIRFGATVKLADEETDEEVTYQIVSEYEADIKNGRISITAPISRGLIGKNEGDSVEVTTPKGVKNYEVLKVAYK